MHLPFSKEKKTELKYWSTGMLKEESSLTKYQLIREDYCPIQKRLKQPVLLYVFQEGRMAPVNRNSSS